MKNRLFALIAVIIVTITGGIMPTPILLPSAQAVTTDIRGETLVIGVGKSVRSSKTIRVKGVKQFYFECKEPGSSYDYIQISGFANTGLSPSNGSRTDIYSFPKKGEYSFNIKNTTQSYNDSITVIVE